MANAQKVTITLPVATVERIRQLVDAHEAPSMSGLVTHAANVALDDVAGWGISAALANTGGELSAQERVWADSVLDHGQRSGAA